ncbi:MAG TPA: cytochrome c biogenesis protein CcsA [Acidimicrobiia bacterium]|jgi:heme exporter protein C
MTKRMVLPGLSAIATVAALYLAWGSSPDVFQGDFVRIMYVHVPSSWLAFLAFGVTALGSALWLWRKTIVWDRIAEASAEIGVVFTGLAILTGAIWGEPVWGTYWDWGDARMASTALMMFVYLGYLALRRATPDPIARARRSSILGLIAVVQVPLVYFSVTFWRTLHQGQTVRPDGIQMDGSMVAALLGGLAAFTLLYLSLMVERVRLARLEDENTISDSVAAGAAVTSPNLDGIS